MGLRGWVLGLLAAGVALCAIIAGGCGSGDSLTPAEAHVLAEGGIIPAQPEIQVPPGFPPKKLVVKDLHKGTGLEAQKGDDVQIQYYGIAWGSGLEHASSWNYEHIPTFELGSHRILRAFNLAIPGMKEGGSRELLVPSTLYFYPDEKKRPLGRLDALIYKVYLVKVYKNQDK
jgi:peptidylprolyl isomerase